MGTRSEQFAARLKEQDAQRKQEADQRKAEASDQIKSASFLKMFNESVTLLKEAIEGAKEVVETERGAHFDRVEAQITQLANDTALSSVFLPKYEQRHSQEVLAKLTDSLKAQRNTLMPKKAFKFSSKAKATATNEPAPVISAPAPIVFQALSTLDENTDQECMLSGLRGGRYVRRDVKGKDLLIEDCEDIELHVPVTIQALFIRRANRCKLYFGPVEGAAHIDDVDNSILFVGCRQMRIHRSNHVDLYVHVQSEPMLESCTELHVAPYAYSYPTKDQDFTEAHLTGVNMWNQFNDFKWLKEGVPSPHWGPIPEEKRITAVLEE